MRRWLSRAALGACFLAVSATTVAEVRADAKPKASARALERVARRVAARIPARVETAPKTAAVLPASPVLLEERRGAPGALVYAPTRARTRRVTVMLHGMCDEPENECPYFAGAVTPRSWLVCPRATLRCDGGGSIWPWQSYADNVEASIERVASEYPNALDANGGRTLMGFSLGAIRGMDLAHAGAGRWKSVVLIGAKIHPDARRLRAAGVERLLLAAGDYDMMKWHMAGQAARLVRQGYPAAFMSLGKIGHWFPHDFEARLARGLAWVDGDDEAFAPSAPGEIAYLSASASAANSRSRTGGGIE